MLNTLFDFDSSKTIDSFKIFEDTNSRFLEQLNTAQ